MLNKKNRYLKALIGILLASVIVSSTLSTIALTEDSENSSANNNAVTLNTGEYSEYLSKHSSEKYSQEKITISAGSIISAESNSAIKSEDGIEVVHISNENKYAEYRFTVNESGLFNINLAYKPVEGSGMNIRLGFQFDGVSPYKELDDVSFSRIWEDKNEKLQLNDNGDELRPEQKEKFRFNTQWVENALGIYNLPYAVFLEKGVHTLKINRVTEELLISNIVLEQYGANIPDYDTYIKENSNISKASKDYTIEAETAFEKSSSTLAATIDNTNAGMSPANATKQVVNSFGKDYWKENSQWASWTVPEDVEEGLYILRFRAKQSENVGIATFRKLYINGEIPFMGAECVRFEYIDGWQISTFQDDEPYLVALKAGDVITLEATTGPMAEPLNKIYTSVNMLNDIYQSIIMVTSPSPDSERDYNIQKEIPTLIDDFKNARKLIDSVGKDISAIMGEKNSKVYFINKFVTLLDSFIENYRLIVPELSNFKSHIDSYAGQTYDFNILPLELDKIILMSPESQAPEADVGFGEYMSFQFKRFIVSFFSDYEKKSTDKNTNITVWTSLGRDQAQAMKQIILNDFTPKTGINVDFKITTVGLANAILSGKEPDIALSLAPEDVIDFAMRGKVLELSDYIKNLPRDYMEQFTDNIWDLFRYKNNIYAMPITQEFYVLFYRTDIFEKLGLEVPDTWDDFYKVLRELQRNNFSVGIQESSSGTPGISAGIMFYESLLFQNGEEYYADNMTKVNFESNGGKKAFLDWVELYKSYGLDVDYDATSRFRSGEMPLIVSGFSFFNTISTVAPEISSRWEMAPFPALVDKNGNLNRATASSGSGTMILKSAKERGKADEAFEFVKWWAGADAQVKYSSVMQSLQGIAGRPSVANMSAFEKLGWSDKDLELITEQRKYTKVKSQVPGSYIVSRYLTNALRTSYNNEVDPLRQLSIQCRKINVELERKREEFQKN